MFDSGPSLVQENSDFLDPLHRGIQTARRGEANLPGALVDVPSEPCDCRLDHQIILQPLLF